jgi:ribose-phosphate pyrophosphokinase
MMLIKSYPDGGKYVVNESVMPIGLEQYAVPQSTITYRINSYEDLFLLKSFKDANPNLKQVTIPCLFQQQHDRRFKPNESFELKLVCDFINSCEFEKVLLYHPHSDVGPALINNCEVISNYFFIKGVLADIELTDPLYKENLILMSADAGGFKSLMKLCDELEWFDETYSASKFRDKGKLIQKIYRKDFSKKDILIIDDICVYGGTFVGLFDLLKTKNIGNLYLAVSHITVPNPNPLLESFTKIYTTNSKNLDYSLSNIKQFNLF